RRKGRKQTCPAYRHRATSRLYPLLPFVGRGQTSPRGNTEPPRIRLIGVVPHPNILGGQPQHPRLRRPRVGRAALCASEARYGARVAAVARALPARSGGFTPPYEISYRGVKLPRVSAVPGALLHAAAPICRRCAPATQQA